MVDFQELSCIRGCSLALDIYAQDVASKLCILLCSWISVWRSVCAGTVRLHDVLVMCDTVFMLKG